MKTIIPSYIKSGDTVGIVSTASFIDEALVLPAASLLEQKGYKVLMGQHVLTRHYQYAGSDLQRAADLQQMIDSPDVKAIFCSRGGYGTLRIMSMINWENFIKKPKWIVGFSDISVLHACLHKKNIASLHAVMPGHFIKNNIPSESFTKMMDVLLGNELHYEIEASVCNRSGEASGSLIGGNLSILYSLRGTEYDIDTEGKILFIEDLSEYLYHLDRIMMNLKYGGKLSHIAALLVGSFTAMKDGATPFGKNAKEIILDAVSEYNYPVVFDFPAGHQQSNFPMKMGCMATLDAGNKVILKQ